jgi:5-formyltetrahydrofolate cyclo-ligase
MRCPDEPRMSESLRATRHAARRASASGSLIARPRGRLSVHGIMIPVGHDLGTLRRRLRAARRALGSRRQRANAEAIMRRLARMRVVRGARRIALYVAADGEPGVLDLIRRLPRRGRRWYLPVLRGRARGRLWFVRHRPGQKLRPNRFGIPEPPQRRRVIQPLHGLDLVLMPLVGFDADCNRLGMGAGYYDRSLAPLRRRRHWRRPLLVGVAHECQRLERLTPQPWDVPLDAVVTEVSLYARIER